MGMGIFEEWIRISSDSVIFFFPEIVEKNVVSTEKVGQLRLS